MTSSEAVAKIRAGEVAAAGVFDRHGMFAKEPDTVDHVSLEFDDGTTATISAETYESLTTAERDEINNAGALPQEYPAS